MPKRNRFYEGCFAKKYEIDDEETKKIEEEEMDSNITIVKINKKKNIGIDVKDDNSKMKESINNLLSNVDIDMKPTKKCKNKNRNNIVLEI